ncbi:MAG: hypothetical protein KAG53_12135 [Endozoicomonadaceae bacterium]|nr:hypothetical protein [Endozoicomonadaceae bacterium]
MTNNKDSFGSIDISTQNEETLQCEEFRERLMQNIRHLQYDEGRQVLETLNDIGQWHAAQMNGFLKTLVLPPITEAIVDMHKAITTQHIAVKDANAEASIRNGVELADMTYGGAITVSRSTEDQKQVTLLTLNQLQHQIDAVQRQTAIELAGQSGDIGLIRRSMILDGLSQSMKSLAQCLLCATFPDNCNSDTFSYIHITEDEHSLFDSLSLCPRGRNTWAPAGIPVTDQSMYSQSD